MNKHTARNGMENGGEGGQLRKSVDRQHAAVDQIGEQLRESFRDILDESVPDRFAALLDQLEEAENSGGRRSGTDEAASRAGGEAAE